MEEKEAEWSASPSEFSQHGGDSLHLGQASRDTVLIIDDDVDISRLIAVRLVKAGYNVLEAHDGLDGLKQFFDHRPNLVILDIMLPKLDGWKVCQRIREVSQVPIVMLTAKGQEIDEVRGLAMGADDYLSKPFTYQKLLARVEAVLRRHKLPPADISDTMYADGVLSVDFWRREVHLRGKLIDLSPQEYRLLTCLVKNAGRVMTHRELLEQVWGPNYDSIANVKLYVGYLRRKLELNPDQPKMIVSVWGVGYRYEKPRKDYVLAEQASAIIS